MNSTNLINKNLSGAEIRRKRFDAQFRLVSIALFEQPHTPTNEIYTLALHDAHPIA